MKEGKDMPRDMPRSPTAVGAVFAAALVLGLAAVLAVAALPFLHLPFGPGREVVTAAAAPVAAAGAGLGLIALLLGGILLVLVGSAVLLLLLLICCMCKGCGGGLNIPLPGLPDLRKLAGILHGIAGALRASASAIDTANSTIDPAREKLSTITNFTVSKPTLESKGTVNIGIWSGEVWVITGWEDWSPFDNDATQKIRAFADDVTGKTAMDNASSQLRGQAALLDQQANTLEGQT
jgi:hypothetical protein